LGALAADIFWAFSDLEVLDLAVFAAVLSGRLARVADFFAAILVFPVVFLATRLVLLTVFLTGVAEAVVRFVDLLFTAVEVFFAANFVLLVVFGAARFDFLAAVLTLDVDFLTAFLVERFVVLTDFLAEALVLPAFFVPASLAPGVFFGVFERRGLAVFLTVDRLDGFVFLTTVFVFRADRWTPDFFGTVFFLLAGIFFIDYDLSCGHNGSLCVCPPVYPCLHFCGQQSEPMISKGFT
jgi:hypothetical protein